MQLTRFPIVIAIAIGLNLLGHGLSSANWQTKWEKTLAAAIEEGEVRVFTGGGYEAVYPEFQKAFPDIKLIGITGRGSQIALRIMAERRAGKYLADVCICGITTPYKILYGGKAVVPLRPVLVLPDILDKSKWFEKKHRYVDPEGKYIFAFMGNVGAAGQIAYNTNLVDPKQFKSYWDFVKPKWRGKVAIRHPKEPGAVKGSLRFFYFNPELGPKYLRALFGELNATYYRGFAQGLDWVARGKYPLCILCPNIYEGKKQGLPIDQPSLLKEGTSLSPGYGSIVKFKNAPNPNAADVFINWILSREGQAKLQSTVAIRSRGTRILNSLRNDVPKDHIPKELQRIKGEKYLFASQPQMMDMSPITKLINKTLAEAKKK